MIDKDTKIYCSFSSNPGNNGCIFFNDMFEKNGVNAIYKSFYSKDILESISAVKILGIKGFAVSMPFKVEIVKFVDVLSPDVKEIGAANTIINDGVLKAYNTDWMGVYEYLRPGGIGRLTHGPIDKLTILGNGGFSKAVQYACNKLNISTEIITRKNWDTISDVSNIVFNATPVDITHRNLIDGRPHTVDGKIIANLQAIEQYKIYTNELS